MIVVRNLVFATAIMAGSVTLSLQELSAFELAGVRQLFDQGIEVTYYRCRL
jgi:hypothetical protein